MIQEVHLSNFKSIFRSSFSSSIVSSPIVLSFATKAMLNLCSDTSERYLAASTDVSYLQKKFFNQTDLPFDLFRKQFMCMILVHQKKHRLFEKNINQLWNYLGVELGMFLENVFLIWIKEFRPSELGYCIRSSPKFHLLSLSSPRSWHICSSNSSM